MSLLPTLARSQHFLHFIAHRCQGRKRHRTKRTRAVNKCRGQGKTKDKLRPTSLGNGALWLGQLRVQRWRFKFPWRDGLVSRGYRCTTMTVWLPSNVKRRFTLLVLGENGFSKIILNSYGKCIFNVKNKALQWANTSAYCISSLFFVCLFEANHF